MSFSLSQSATAPSRWQQIGFHLLLNLGRLISYALVGLMIGALGSVLVASGQMAGLGSPLRRGVALVTGLLLIWFGLAQINPDQVLKVPFLNPMTQASWHDRLSRAMQALFPQSSTVDAAAAGVGLGIDALWLFVRREAETDIPYFQLAHWIFRTKA